MQINPLPSGIFCNHGNSMLKFSFDEIFCIRLKITTQKIYQLWGMALRKAISNDIYAHFLGLRFLFGKNLLIIATKI